ncbi:MAG: rRNA pseudouridine synthase [Anaerolineales bacterium]|nr:rRNA pseudouridine synthase [Anaerolineales bacterium]
MTRGHQPQEERLQKVLAHTGVASRRASEALIEQGRVTVNGQTVTVLGFKVDPRRDIIAVDGRQLPRPSAKPVYILLNKPRDVLTAASDDRGRRTVVDLVEVEERVYPVGRLDLRSEGLVLLTNDGELAEKLTHPRSHVEKEYLVLVSGRPTTPTLARWRRGEIEVEGKPTGRNVVERLKIEGDNTWLKIILTEGRKRQIREVAKALGHPVLRLERVRLGPIKLGHLKPGKWRHLKPAEIEQLKRSVKL